MIGVLANHDEELIREFFQLFKAPWEFYRPEERYDVVLCASEGLLSASGVVAKLIVVYAGQEKCFDREENIAIGAHRKGGTLSYKGCRFPIYGDILTFLDDRKDLLEEEESRKSVGVRRRVNGKNIVRIGYDLFHELQFLLSVGQPYEYADIPTVEIHIGLFRDLIIEAGVALIEIPPIPEGYAFIACLTHDIDHPSIRLHRWDHTALGFLYRALIGSARDVLSGRASVQQLMINWVAAAKLPFIYLGLARDFWLEFGRYLDIEKDVDSTFFVLPFKGKPGETTTGPAPRIRASRYAAADIAEYLRTIVSAGREIGLHGIDAWGDSEAGLQEKRQVERAVGVKNIGVRMHWLYFNESSPTMLDQAGFIYDSTVGYNQTIGYRAGTTQAYKPLNVQRLIELPLHVMDTALFSPNYLNLTAEGAKERVSFMINAARQHGGVLTINWHDRSLAPERLWGGFYVWMLEELRRNGAWCAGAGRVVTWFQQRRSVMFHKVSEKLKVTFPKPEHSNGSEIPGLKVRVYKKAEDASLSSCAYTDSRLESSTNLPLSSGHPASSH